MAKVIEFRPAEMSARCLGVPRAAVVPRRDHPAGTGLVELFDWAEHPPDRPVMPTLVACALDRVGQHIENPLRISKVEALEALRAIRAHYREEGL